jgi:hypothetical protein
MKTYLETILYITIGLIAMGIVVFLFAGCGSTQAKKELLEKYYPECTVSDDLELKCPTPYDED